MIIYNQTKMHGHVVVNVTQHTVIASAVCVNFCRKHSVYVEVYTEDEFE